MAGILQLSKLLKSQFIYRSSTIKATFVGTQSLQKPKMYLSVAASTSISCLYVTPLFDTDHACVTSF